MTLSADLLKFTILAGMIPAVMTSLIAPKHWVPEFALCFGSCNPLRLLEPPFELPVIDTILPGYSVLAACLLIIGSALALRARSLKSLISLIPLALFLGRGWLDPWGDAAVVMAGILPDGSAIHLGEWLYNISCSALYISFIFSRGDYLRTRAFLALMAVLTGLLFYEPDFGVTEFLFFASSTLGLRMIFLFLRVNLDDFIRIGWGRSGLLFLHSIALLLPIWLLVGAGFWLQSTAAGWIEDKAYAQRPLCTASVLRLGLSDANSASDDALKEMFLDVEGQRCPISQDQDEIEDIASHATNLSTFFRETKAASDPCSAGGNPDPAHRDIETDLCYYGELLHAGREARLKAALAAQYAKNHQSETDARNAVNGAIRDAMPDVRIPHRYKCTRFPWLGCEIGKTAKWATQNAINGGQARIRRTVANEAASQIAGAAAQVDGATSLADQNAKAITDAMRRTTQSALRNGFDVMGILDHMLFVILCLMILKALFFVFARVAYSSVDRETAITLAAPEEEIPEGTMINAGKRYEVPAGRFFYSKRAQMEGIAPKIAVPPPQPAACLFSRLFGGAYFLSVADRSGPDAGPVVFKTGNIREFVEWSLEPGEEVVFHFKDFIAIEDRVKLSTFVSFRLSTLLLGRILFRRARGPGRLVLRTAGPAETSIETDTELSKPIHRLVSWNRGARFKLDVERGFFDIYFSTVHLRKDTDSHVIFVAEDSERKTYGTGAARFIKQFLLPI